MACILDTFYSCNTIGTVLHVVLIQCEKPFLSATKRMDIFSGPYELLLAPCQRATTKIEPCLESVYG